MEKFHWEKYHDWSIGQIVIDWVDGVMKIQLWGDKQYCEIEITDLVSPSLLPKNFPIFPSCRVRSSLFFKPPHPLSLYISLLCFLPVLI